MGDFLLQGLCLSQRSKPYMTSSYRWIAGSRQEVCVSFLALCVCPDPIYFIRPGLAHKRGTLVNAFQSQTPQPCPASSFDFLRLSSFSQSLQSPQNCITPHTDQNSKQESWAAGLANMPCTGRNTKPNSSTSSSPLGERLKLAHESHLARETSRKDLSGTNRLRHLLLL